MAKKPSIQRGPACWQAGQSTAEVRKDHVDRYVWAKSMMDEVKAGYHVIDAGCGVGYGSQTLGRDSYGVLGMDISLEALRHAKKYFGEGVDYMPCDMGRLSLEQKSKDGLFFPMCDYFVAFEFLEHIPGRHPFLKLAARSTRGYGFFSVPNAESIPWSKEEFPEHLLHFTPEGFERLLTDAGWEVVSRHGQMDKGGCVTPTKGEDTWEKLSSLKPRTLVVMAKPFLGE